MMREHWTFRFTIFYVFKQPWVGESYANSRPLFETMNNWVLLKSNRRLLYLQRGTLGIASSSLSNSPHRMYAYRAVNCKWRNKFYHPIYTTIMKHYFHSKNTICDGFFVTFTILLHVNYMYYQVHVFCKEFRLFKSWYFLNFSKKKN